MRAPDVGSRLDLEVREKAWMGGSEKFTRLDRREGIELSGWVICMWCRRDMSQVGWRSLEHG